MSKKPKDNASLEAKMDTLADYMRGNGLAPNTVNAYVRGVYPALSHPQGFRAYMESLTSLEHFRQTRYGLRWWAKMTSDKALEAAVVQIKAPRRGPRRPKVVVPRDVWQQLGVKAQKEIPPFSAVLWMMIFSGMRISEILELRRDELREAAASGRAQITVKGRSHQQKREWWVSPLVDDAVQFLARPEIVGYYGATDWTFVWETISTTKRGAAYRVAAWIPRPYHPHAFRRTVANVLDELNVPHKVIAAYGGWASVSTLEQCYLQSTPQQQYDAGAMLKKWVFGGTPPQPNPGGSP